MSKKLSGYIITYNSTSRKDITKINYFLFGRIATIKKGEKSDKYYYPGFFETTPYKKISNGCYFVKEIYDDFDGLLHIFPAVVEFDSDEMKNARDYWNDKIEGKVNNW